MPKRLQSPAEATASAALLGDQRAGESGAAAPTSFRGVLPGVPTYSAYAPSRSLRNARRPSAGLHCGKRLFAAPPIASRAPVPSGATSQIAQRPPALRSNASVEPSRDQLGLTLSPAPSNATCVFDPSTGTISSAEPAVLASAIAIDVPS